MHRAMGRSKRGEGPIRARIARRSESDRRTRESCERRCRKGVRAPRPPIGERALIELPDAFVGVELRGIAGEAVEVEPGIAGLERADRVAAGEGAIVPDPDHGAEAESITEEGADLGVPVSSGESR
jgi:hypothetical protein